MPRFGNRKEVDNGLRVALLVNETDWKMAGTLLSSKGLTRPQYIRACLDRLLRGGTDKEIRYVQKRNELVR